MSMSEINVVSLGARTPVGPTAESSAAAVRAGISRLGTHPFMVDTEGEGLRAAMDGHIAPLILGHRRIATLCRSAIEEALGKLSGRGELPMPVGLMLALPEERPGFSHSDIGAIVDSLRQVGAEGEWTLNVEVIGRGHAGGLLALERAAQKIERRELDLCLVGGTESYFAVETIDWLQANRQLRGPGVRGGFTPGEGAGVVALASEGLRRRLRLPSLGTVRGVGKAQETKLIKTDVVNLGEGLAEALRQAKEDAGGALGPIDAVYCDINGERYRSEEWGLALLRPHTLVKDAAYVAPSDCWGDVGAATGPLLCTLAVRSWARRYAPGPLAVVWAGSEAGLRVAVILEGPARKGDSAWEQ